MIKDTKLRNKLQRIAHLVNTDENEYAVYRARVLRAKVGQRRLKSDEIRLTRLLFIFVNKWQYLRKGAKYTEIYVQWSRFLQVSLLTWQTDGQLDHATRSVTIGLRTSISTATRPNYKDMARQSCATVPRWRFFASCICSEPRATHFRPAF